MIPINYYFTEVEIHIVLTWKLNLTPSPPVLNVYSQFGVRTDKIRAAECLSPTRKTQLAELQFPENPCGWKCSIEH